MFEESGPFTATSPSPPPGANPLVVQKVVTKMPQDRALRVHGHAGLDGLTRPGGQTQTLIGGVIRGSGTNECRAGLIGRTVVLVCGVRGGQGHIDSNWVVREVVARIEPDCIYQEVSILRGYLKYRDSSLGENSTVANDQDSKDRVHKSTPCLAVGDLRGEQPGEHTAIGQADCARRGGGNNRDLRTACVVEVHPVHRNRHGDVSVMTVGAPVKARQNTIWKEVAAGRVRRLWPSSQDNNAILGGEGSDAKQQRASQQEQHP